MQIVIPDDYQDAVRTLDCFRKLDGHAVTVYHDTVTDVDENENDSEPYYGGTEVDGSGAVSHIKGMCSSARCMHIKHLG